MLNGFVVGNSQSVVERNRIQVSTFVSGFEIMVIAVGVVWVRCGLFLTTGNGNFCH